MCVAGYTEKDVELAPPSNLQSSLDVVIHELSLMPCYFDSSKNKSSTNKKLKKEKEKEELAKKLNYLDIVPQKK
jgi:hypothetical protein